MKSKYIYIFWAIVFFLAGVGLLVGIIDLKHLSQQDRLLILAAGSIAFILTYFLDGTRKWAWLLPGFICAGLAIVVEMQLNGTSDSSLLIVPILTSLALWFYVGFALDRKHWGLLIPAYILTSVAIMMAINSLTTASIMNHHTASTFLLAFNTGAGVMFLLALPFFVAYFWSIKNWWALIPAGSLTSLGLALVLQYLYSDHLNNFIGVFAGVLLLGLSVTCAILWLRRKNQPTAWAIYPSAGLFVLAILAFIFGNGWNTISDQTKAICFAAASAGCFIGYFVHGLRKWGWLFPALFCAAMAITIWMSINNMEDSPLMGLPIFASFALPFYVGFACEPKHRWLLVPAFILTVITILTLTVDSDYEGTVVMSLFALPFFVAYLWSKKNWWAFIPGGFFATIGLVSLIEEVVPHNEYASLPNTMHWGVFNWVLFLLLAVTFGVLWLRRNAQPTQWAAYPAVSFMALAILSFILGEKFQEYWLSTVMLVIAGMLVLALFTRKVPAAGAETPKIKA